jgi:hypothetical protein
VLIRQAVLAQIRDGAVTQQFRRWTRPTVKAGGTLTTAIGVLAIEAVEPVEPESLTAADATAAGYTSVDDLLEDTRPGGTLYRIRLHVAGDDPRIALRNNTTLDPAALADLTKRLERLDRGSTHGPWTVATLRLIAAHPAVRAGDLADRVGRERLAFKADVRKLKALGLTESLGTGYRIAPRGAAYLAAADSRDDAASTRAREA